MMTKMALLQKAVSKVFGDLVSKAIDDGVDVLKSAIKNADLDRKSYNQNLQTRLYQLILDALNRFTHNKFEKQDKLYDAAESIIKGYISSKGNTDATKSGLNVLVSGVDDDTCQEFLEILCGEICRNDNSDLYKEFDMLWKKQESEYFRGEFAKIDQNGREILEQLNNMEEVLDFIKRNMNRQEGDKLGHNGFPIVNRTDEYAKKWDKNVFLNDFNKRDRNAGVNIKLKDIYLEKHLPHYVWKTNDEPSYDLKELLREYIVDNDDKKMLLILGQGGIGKSTLITWIMANLIEKKEGVLVYQFASDLYSVDWQSDNVLKVIFSVIGLKYDELENKILILDGFDEIHTDSDRKRVLNQIYHSFTELNYLKRMSLIITCRKNYIDELQKVICDHVTLQTWDDEQIKSFCEIYESMSKRKVSQNTIDKMVENKRVFGIPLILYMVLALAISIERNASLVDIYDKIFAVDGGVYDRCINDLSYGKEHRISKVKQQIHQISQRVAFWIFENNSEKAVISQIEFGKICDIVMKEAKEKTEDIQSDVLLGNYFEPIKYYEGIGTDELQFVHRSIYEYFVSIYFFESMRNLTSREVAAGKLGILLKYGYLSEQMLEFIKYKFDSIKKYNLANVTIDIFQIMLRDGMTFHIGIPCKNVIECEFNIFANMLQVVHLWNHKLGEVDNKIVLYLQCGNLYYLNLEGIILKEADLVNVDLSGANLRGADLSGSNFGRANLYEADLSGANLKGVNLRKAYLVRACLSGANLCEVDLKGADLIMTQLMGVNLDGVDLSEVKLIRTLFDDEQVDALQMKYDLSMAFVNLSKTDEIISYKEYCTRKQKNDI